MVTGAVKATRGRSVLGLLAKSVRRGPLLPASITARKGSAVLEVAPAAEESGVATRTVTAAAIVTATRRDFTAHLCLPLRRFWVGG